MPPLLIATRNKGKVKEIKTLLYDLPFEIKSLDDLDIVDNIEETGKTYEENAILKAKTIGEKTGFLTLGEDSGLEIDVLGGWPGIHSARHTPGTDDDRIDKILAKLKGIPKEKRSARYRAVVALFYPKTKKTEVFAGTAEGLITEKRIGNNGFGYDPIFYSTDLDKTFGQAEDDEKNCVSHRARALAKLKEFLITSSPGTSGG